MQWRQKLMSLRSENTWPSQRQAAGLQPQVQVASTRLKESGFVGSNVG
jgi:hypothetical protein